MHQGGLPAPSATLMASFEEQSGVAVGLCPRSLVADTVARLNDEFALDCLVGFEIEITFCRRNSDQDSKDVYEPLHTNTASSTFTDNQYTESYPLMMATVQALQGMGISVEQMHPEAGAGQYEFVLPPLPPVQAVDTLVQARQCIQQIAATHGLRATCHPQPFPGIGTACHANISLNSAGDALPREKKQMQFMGFVLAHLRGLCAFTMPEAASYARFADDKWKPGAWVGWGTQNRKMPLRRIATLEGLSARWEVRCVDGFGNMYLCLYVILRAGLQGMREGTKMELGDCQGVYWRVRFVKGCRWLDCVADNPSRLSDAELTGLGFAHRLTVRIEESMDALDGDTALRNAIGSNVVDHYLAMKRAEQDMLNAMSEGERRVWLMDRY
jgi:glutamine synthetase